MKAKIVQDKVRQLNPEFNKKKFRGMNPVEKRLYAKRTPPVIPLPKGEIWDHPEAFKLVELGIAVPEDNECREAAAMSDEQIAEATAAYRKLSRGAGTGIGKYDAQPEEIELDDEFNALLEEENDIVSTD